MKNDKKHSRRVRNMVLSLAFTAIVLAVATFAWFIGTGTVHVDPFQVEVAVTEDLEISLNGVHWHDSVSISEDSHNQPAFVFPTEMPAAKAAASAVYETHTNSWGGAGLVPKSSVGEIDPDVSRLMFFEKASLTPSGGGYRLIVSRTPNNVVDEGEVDGYLVFDMFIRNYTGRNYIPELDILDEEAIYLDVDSVVRASDPTLAVHGIQNSVRVAFAQIGRVIGTTATEAADGNAAALLIQGISCDAAVGVTSICSRHARIWEPNETAHAQGAIDYYENACRPRLANAGTPPAMVFGPGDCGDIEDGVFYPTYAFARENLGDDQRHLVDVYDGVEYNGFTPDLVNGPLRIVDTFTDTDKVQPGVSRPPFMFLAPNSVTKVRVYVWLEGQDVDNYDFAAHGRNITLNFGFTKQRINDPNTTTTTPAP